MLAGANTGKKDDDCDGSASSTGKRDASDHLIVVAELELPKPAAEAAAE